MKRLKTILTIGSFAVALSGFAIPPKLGTINYRQPDGSTIGVQIHGTRENHVITTEDGTLVKQGADDFYYVANLDSNGVVTASDVRAKGKGMDSGIKFTEEIARKISESRQLLTRGIESGKGMYKTSYPTTGNPKVPVILVEFQDVKFNINYDTKASFNEMLNGDNFTEQGSPGSLKKYFEDQSSGKFVPQFDVYGPVTLPQKSSYYGEDGSILDHYSHYMVSQSLKILDPDVDFSQYDADNDGDIDFVYIIYAGYGQNRSSRAKDIWPHAGHLRGDADFCQVDGKWANFYACSNEIIYGTDYLEGISAFLHEYSHIIGLPDLYTTDMYNFHRKTPGQYSVLDYGVYLNDGKTPPNYTAYERNALKWNEGFELKPETTVTLNEISTGEFGVVNTSNPNEFFLFENRQQTGWDKYLPNHGLLIWHIQYNENAFSNNEVNVLPDHQYVDLIEANNIPGFDINFPENSKGFVFPGTSNNTEFTATSSPAFLTWNGEDLKLPITNITETASGKIKFDVAGGDPNKTDDPEDDNPSVDNPSDDPSIDEPGDEPGKDDPSIDEPGDEPGKDDPSIDEPGKDDPSVELPEEDDPSTDEPGNDEPSVDEPGSDNPGTDVPGEENPDGDDTSAISAIEATADGVYHVYSISGAKIKECKDIESVKSLQKGIYIINGKKVAVR